MSLLWVMFTSPFILRAFVVGIVVALFAYLISTTRTGLVPQEDKGFIQMFVSASPGTSMEAPPMGKCSSWRSGPMESQNCQVPFRSMHSGLPGGVSRGTVISAAAVLPKQSTADNSRRLISRFMVDVCCFMVVVIVEWRKQKRSHSGAGGFL